MNQVAIIDAEKAGAIMEAVIVKGDLDQLSPQERAKYYVRVCESIGLNPMTKPFEYIKLNGRLRLYALKDATDQLRKIYNVSVTDLIESERGDVFIVTAKVRDGTGRTDAAKGAVALKGLAGEALANALMKCETKAKRRATMSICGLGFLDETEVEDIPTDVRRYTKTKPEAKDLYSALQLEVDELPTAAASRVWLANNANRLALLPLDWEAHLRTRCEDRMAESPGTATVVTSTLDDQPETGDVIWDDPTPPEWSNKWDELGPVKQAGVLCNDAAFQKFLCEATGRDVDSVLHAAEYVRLRCKVKSRSEIKVDNYTGQLWRDLVAEYRAWQRADEASPTPPEASAPPVSHPGTEQAGGAEFEVIGAMDKRLTDAAKLGTEELKRVWATIPNASRGTLKAAMDKRHKPDAEQADQAKQPA